MSEAAALVPGLLKGDRRALARLLTRVENRAADDALELLYSHTGRAHIIGITGAPGTGKSTLVTALAKTYRGLGNTVAVLAVDPSSPFTGGALLGDRIRMRDLSGDAGVFIRSMATRGTAGGLARTARDMVRVLDAAGFDIVLVETVGAGQSEVAIARAAHTTLVVEAPGLGDDVQAIKAGILEIADVLVVNKADRPGAASTVRALRVMLDTGHPSAKWAAHHGRLVENAPASSQVNGIDDLWLPPIVETVASEGQGVDALVSAIADHRNYLMGDDRLARLEAAQLDAEVMERLREALLERLLQRVSVEKMDDLLAQVQARELDVQGAVTALLHEAERAHVPNAVSTVQA